MASRLLKKSLVIWSRCDSGSSAAMRRDSIGARTSGEGSPFSYVGLETRVGENYPLRPIPVIVNDALAPLAIFQRFITIEVEFAYHNGDGASSKPVAGRSAERYVDGQLKRVRSSPQLPRRRRSIRSRSHSCAV